MTLSEIIKSALSQLGMPTDAAAVALHGDRLKGYANDAVQDIAAAVKPSRCEYAAASEGRIDLSGLERACVKLTSVRQDGRELEFCAGGDDSVLVAASGECELRYVYAPAELKADGDAPELPEHTHWLIPLYVVARERMAADTANQQGAEPYMNVYLLAKRSLRPNRGESDSYRIVNRW
ncbi:MAG: hypothetical protein Q4B99_02195 [Clostridia bacterium]|nr:hypothetical protein [Clostridia bacterium]